MFEYLRKFFGAKSPDKKPPVAAVRARGPETFGKKPKVVVRPPTKRKQAKAKRH